MARRTPEEMKPLIKKAKAIWWENQNLNQTARIMEADGMLPGIIHYWYRKENWTQEYEKEKKNIEKSPSFMQKADGFRSILMDEAYEFAQNVKARRLIRQVCVKEEREPTKAEKVRLKSLDDAINDYDPDQMKKASSTVKDISMNYGGMKGQLPDPDSPKRQGPSLVTVGPKDKPKEEPKLHTEPTALIIPEASA
jgi:hypothetical protein